VEKFFRRSLPSKIFFWFCPLHELAHVAKHFSACRALIVDDLDLRGRKTRDDPVEKEDTSMVCFRKVHDTRLLV
jgi:hypothetical protein